MATRRQRPRRTRRKGWSGYILSFLLGAFLVFLGYSYFSHLPGERTPRPGSSSRKPPPADKSGRPAPDSGIEKKEVSPPPSSLPPIPGHPPRIALVIDDLGGENHLSSELLLFESPITFSILPFTTYSKALATEAPGRGKEVILHLPMEPHGYPKVRPGEGALLHGMDEKRLLRQLSEDIDSVPNIKGVSNHMGSRLMEEPDKLKIIFSDLKERGLFFLDSRTTPQTVGLKMARLVGLNAMERTLFIDNSLGAEALRKNLDRLIRISLSTGMAIGIGHPHSATVNAIREMLPRIREKGIELVPLSTLFNESLAGPDK